MNELSKITNQFIFFITNCFIVELELDNRGRALSGADNSYSRACKNQIL